MLSAIGKNVEEMANEHKTRFAARLRELVDTRSVTFVGEEAKQGVCTAASQLPINWANIDMPLAERHARGIPDDYAGNLAYAEADRTRWDCEREEHMFDQIQSNRADATSIMIVCGAHHLHNLRARLICEADTVTHEDVTTADWFDPFVSQFL